MPSLRDIRKRIKSVKNTQKITKAMKMVAASKLRRSQEALMAARPYADKLVHVVGHVAARLGPDDLEKFPLLRHHPSPRKVLLVVITSDRGMAGAFNSNIIRRAERFLWEEKERHPEIRLAVIGRKARDAFRRSGHKAQEHVGVFESLTFARCKEIAASILKEYEDGNLDACFIIYNEFKSAISQKVIVEQFLPVVPAGRPVLTAGVEARGEQAEHGKGAAVDAVDYRYEPGKEGILEELVARHFTTQLWRALLESVASEHGARMSAMDNATRNAGEMVAALTLKYNRARQAYITKELMEIIGGAEALK
ncbi:MAG: ATP synthase F1 subunit gamma [Deltaproteobacteria bacterium]|nr:ATP synthase F1 subunit gamma [Deltaproteobacteria bacterium]